MTSEEYCIDLIDRMLIRFPDFKVKYEHKKSYGGHVIDIFPSVFEEGMDAFGEWEEDETIVFMKKFPGESLCYTDKKFRLQVENITYEGTGSLYKQCVTNRYDHFSMTVVSSRSTGVLWNILTKEKAKELNPFPYELNKTNMVKTLFSLEENTFIELDCFKGFYSMLEDGKVLGEISNSMAA